MTLKVSSRSGTCLVNIVRLVVANFTLYGLASTEAIDFDSVFPVFLKNLNSLRLKSKADCCIGTSLQTDHNYTDFPLPSS